MGSHSEVALHRRDLLSCGLAAALALPACHPSVDVPETRPENTVQQEPDQPELKALHIGSTKQLFLDDSVIDRADHVQRQLHRPVRHAANPMLVPDQPWEQGEGGNGVYLFGGTVLFDETEQLFKMWYRTSLVEETGKTPDGGYRTCYAISKDGLHWQKPILGEVQYGGSTQNNILPPAIGGKEYVRRPNLIKDYQEPDPDKRYKMVYMDEMGGKWVLAKGYSPDGVHWRMNVGRPVSFEPPVLPNGVLFGWDPKLQRYVLFHRMNSKGGTIPADVDGRRVRSEQALVRSTSSDFESWGDTLEIVKRNEAIDPPRWDPAHVGVLAGILYTEDLYIGFLDTCQTHHVEDVPEQSWGTYQNDHSDHRTELVISRDGKNWKRMAPHWEFLRPGLWGTWDREFVALSKPIVRNGEILIYFTGRNLPCGAQHVGHPQRDLLGKVVDGQRMGYAIGLAKLRLDGFAAMEGYEPGGTLTTRPLSFEGNRLLLNARAPKKPFGSSSIPEAPYGRIRVEILDARGQPLRGYTAAECDPFSGDAVEHVVAWKGNSDVGQLAGKPIRLRFYLTHSALYAFQFRGETARPSPINLLCPGCRGSP